MKSDLYKLSNVKVAIVGIGLMGGSLAMALRGKCDGLLGVDEDEVTLKRALEMDLFDELSKYPEDLVPKADLIVLAVPVLAIIEYIRALPNLHHGEATVLDLGSTKDDVIRAMDGLPDRFEAIGGHPMCGSEKFSFSNAYAQLYSNTPFVLSENFRTTDRARGLIEQLVEAVGAFPVWMEPDEHDRFTAITSHFPYLLANSLAYVTPRDASTLAGPGYRSTTRLAGSPVNMMIDVLRTNRSNILKHFEKYIKQMNILYDLLDGDDYSTIEHLLVCGRKNYKNFQE